MVVFVPNQYAEPLLNLLRRSQSHDPLEQEALAHLANEIKREQSGLLYQRWTRERQAGPNNGA